MYKIIYNKQKFDILYRNIIFIEETDYFLIFANKKYLLIKLILKRYKINFIIIFITLLTANQYHRHS